MIITPYDTKACMGYAASLQKISDSIRKAYLLGGGFKHLTWDNVTNTSAAVLQPDYSGTIKHFGHPVFVKGSHNDNNVLVGDGRSMYSVDPHSGEVRPKLIMNSAIVWMETRLKLQLLWQGPNFPFVQSILDYPTMLYGKVFSEALARKYGLEPLAIARCDMLFVYAFWCFSHTEAQYNETDKQSLGHLLAMMIRSSAPDITSVIDSLDYFHSISDVVTALQQEEIVGTQKMTSITLATLFEIAKSTWYLDAGAPAQEIASCSLEHAPTWLASVFLATSNSTMKNNIAVVAQRYKKHADPNQFVNSIIHLLGDQ